MESFEMSDDYSDLQASLDGEDFLGSRGASGRGAGASIGNEGGARTGLWTRVKYWWYRNGLGLPAIGTAKWRERGIPLYELDANGVGVVHGDEPSEDFTMDTPMHIPWRRVMVFVLALCFVGISASLIVSVATTKPRVISHGFDPYIRYSNGSHEFYPLTIMVSLDGFHPSLISKRLTPFLYDLYTLSYERNENITVAPFMLPCFPSQTFPNHWSIVTGKYPRDHGIVSNLFYDAKLDMEFAPGNVDPLLWSNTSEPIWQVLQTAFNYDQKQDWPFKVATHMWPGSDVDFSSLADVPDQRMPYYFDKFDADEKLDHKIDSILQYIDVDSLDSRPQLILSYVPQVDSFGHKHGYPILAGQEKHEEFADMLMEVDSFLQKLTESLEYRNLSNFTNLLIVSDHGMSNIEFPENVLIWEDLIEEKFNKKRLQNVYNEGPLLAITTVDKNDINELKRDIQNSLDTNELGSKFKIFLNGNFPERLNYNNLGDSRIAPIWIIPEPGFAIMTKKNFKNTGKKSHPKTIGSHGYDNFLPEMKSMFIGMGPFFRKGYIKPFENVEIFDMLLDIFGVSTQDRFGDVKNTFFYQNYLGNETFETDAAHLLKLYGANNAYNELWGDTASWGPDESATEDRVEATQKSESADSATAVSSSAPTSVVQSAHTSTTLPSPTTRFTSGFTSASTPASTPASSTSPLHWLDELLDDTKDLIDDIIEDIEDLVKGDTDNST